MIRSSAFMRGEGICTEVSHWLAAFRDWRSCTSLFHHGCPKTRGKQRETATADLGGNNRAGPDDGCRPLLVSVRTRHTSRDVATSDGCQSASLVVALHLLS